MEKSVFVSGDHAFRILSQDVKSPANILMTLDKLIVLDEQSSIQITLKNIEKVIIFK